MQTRLRVVAAADEAAGAALQTMGDQGVNYVVEWVIPVAITLTGIGLSLALLVGVVKRLDGWSR